LRLTSSIGALTLSCLLLGACADTGGGEAEGRERNVYVVKPQDTLYSIAWRYGLDFHDLARWNNIGADFRIAVGQTLTLAPAAATATSKRKINQPASAAAPPRPVSVASGNWAWPTERMFAPQAVPGGGILLPGRVGQDIRAASAGRVVYNGTGIRGYGNLIIIKHGENLLSAYAHNRESLVREGQEVALGELIGHMGEGAPQKPVLYFEIRRNGKPIDPTTLLPKTK
jgi:murein DD-endopeptidase MepM/ murein hydrolase activator NlpD